MATEQQEWETIHALRGLDLCHNKCGDIVCTNICLNYSGRNYRDLIMTGIKIYRDNQIGDKYPIKMPSAVNAMVECKGGHLCKDPVCALSECMRQPSWKFRELIKLALADNLMRALAGE
jgi:hypothetical protein